MKRLCFITLLCLLFFLPFPVHAAKTPYQLHGALSVRQGKLIDSRGKVFQLKGVSTHGIAWFPDYVNEKAFKTLRDQWGANTIRLAVYTQEYGGYTSGGNKKQLESVIDKGVKACSRLGMYCIIDWHILSDGNPNSHKKAANAFFKKMTRRYGKNRNVLYEICNEPNGGTTWPQIKKYAGTIVKSIRKKAPNAIVLIGTPNWSQDVDIAAASPLRGQKNIMYTFHFYAGTHKSQMRKKLNDAISAGLPVFISEFGICDASGNGPVNKTSANAWKKIIQKNRLSYCAWNLSNKNETSSLLKSGTKRLYGWKTRHLSKSGRWVRSMMKK